MKCIVCEAAKVSEFLDLGETTLANKFIAADELDTEEPHFPLKVGFCKMCGHVQLTDFVPPSKMFDNYLYISSMSETLTKHLHSLARKVVGRQELGPDDLVIDVGCNDGTLLSGFKACGVQTLGVDPAANLAERARASGIETRTGYFGEKTAQEIASHWGKASVVTATNTFPHIPDLADFVKGLDSVLSDNGIFVLEAHYLRDLLEQGAFDTVYHEHVSYWALGPMIELFKKYNMEVVDVERLPLHHGQIRAWVRRRGVESVSDNVTRLLSEEGKFGLRNFNTFKQFASKTLKAKEELNATLDKLIFEGYSVVAYGAPAKGNTLLTFLGIGPDRIKYIADRSPLKQGRYTPGTHIPVVDPARILEDQPDYVLLLAWNFSEEIMEQQAEYRHRGGHFIIPVPEVRIC